MKKILLRAATSIEGSRAWLLRQTWFQSVLMPALPRNLRWLLRKVYLTPVDLADRVLGRDAGLPPKAGNFSGDRALHNMDATSQVLVDRLASVARLTPSSQVLDIGCGVGRLAIAMSRFLDRGGRYEGLDIVPRGIEWCQQNIMGPYGNIHFTLADIHNEEYNPNGRISASKYTFPFADETFDIVVLISVFTHMLPADFERYVSEISRILRRNGQICATYHLMTPESLASMKTSGSALRFKHNFGSYWTQSEKVPELAVGYDEKYVREIYAKRGLSDPPAIYPGRWSGRQGYWPSGSALSGQDLIVATKL